MLTLGQHLTPHARFEGANRLCFTYHKAHAGCKDSTGRPHHRQKCLRTCGAPRCALPWCPSSDGTTRPVQVSSSALRRMRMAFVSAPHSSRRKNRRGRLTSIRGVVVAYCLGKAELSSAKVVGSRSSTSQSREEEQREGYRCAPCRGSRTGHPDPRHRYGAVGGPRRRWELAQPGCSNSEAMGRSLEVRPSLSNRPHYVGIVWRRS